jgi:6-phosphogluconolactonase
MTDRLVAANYVEEKDMWRVTLTRPVINAARQVFFLIEGAEKAMILNEVLKGPRDEERLPSQFIVPVDGILTLLLDQAAATLLPAPDASGSGTIERTE